MSITNLETENINPHYDARSYDEISGEYYSAALHPTCHSFNQASRKAIGEHLQSMPLKGKRILEVGTGRSAFLDAVGDRHRSALSITLSDASEGMLAHSNDWQTSNIQRVICCAEDIVSLDKTFDIIIASLGDPYNRPPFWKALKQVMTPSSVCLYTTPAHAWAKTFRAESQDEIIDQAKFIIEGAVIRFVPSLVYPLAKQTDLIQCNGLKVEDHRSINLSEISYYAPKTSCLADDDPLVELYVIKTKK